MFRMPIRADTHLQILEERHAEIVFQAVDNNRERLRALFPWTDATLKAEDTRAFIRDSLKRFAANEGFAAGIWVGERFAGVIGHHKLDWLNRQVEMGYWLGREFEGRGVITDACRALVTRAFTEWKLNRVEIRCVTGNERSAAVPRRLGFTEEGILREAFLIRDAYHDLRLFAMIARDWPIKS
jgi:ribosomal-protein-serine acetyltransferase